MCGRFNVETHPLSRLLLEMIGMPHPGPDNPNAAPTERIAVVRRGDEGAPEVVTMRWWLTPHWAKEPGTRYSMFNAKAETVHESRAFRDPFRRRRCLVPISGFYEWTRQDGRKIPWHIRPRQDPGLLLAGIWDTWRDPAGDEVLESFAVITTDAAAGLAFVHNRQPVMLGIGAAWRWLDHDTPVDALRGLLAPGVPVPLDVVPVSTWVNNARHKDARCTDPVGASVPVDATPGST
jgi:putative SOS response-associated peptidase YedK